MDCSELKALLEDVEDGVIPRWLKPQVESHLETCRKCAARLSNYMKIAHILTATVYGEPAKDKYLGFLNHLTGQKFTWGTGEEKPPLVRRRRVLTILKVFAGFLVAAGAGTSGLIILGRSGCVGRIPVTGETADTVQSEPAALPKVVPPPVVESKAPAETAVAEGADTVSQKVSDEEGIYARLNRPGAPGIRQAPAAAAPADSSRLRVLEAELSALRAAVSRTPRDKRLVSRAMDKYRQVLAERRRLKQPSRVRDYYNLGYMYYLREEYPQTAVVTEEGIRSVRIGPVEYLHYLKAMSHYRIAQQAAEPLPADTSRDETARTAGALLRAELDAEGRRQAITELRRSISEFSHLLNNPEMEQTAREWINKSSNLIEKLSKSP